MVGWMDSSKDEWMNKWLDEEQDVRRDKFKILNYIHTIPIVVNTELNILILIYPWI